jgi:hypothetical protein
MLSETVEDDVSPCDSTFTLEGNPKGSKFPLIHRVIQQYASEVYTILARRGSRIKLLSTGPVHLPALRRGSPDKDGHVWPYYYHIRANVMDSRGREQAIKMSLPEAEEEMPDMKFMFLPR